MGLSVIQISVKGYDKNFSYLIHDEETKNAVVVDPCGDLDKILGAAQDNDLDLVGVLLTHTHNDHIDKLDELLRSYSIPVYVHELGVGKIVSQSRIFKMRDRETLTLGAQQIMVIYTPGHTEDAVCFYIEKDQTEDEIPKVITGDTLFVEGCGRTNKDGVQSLYNSLIRLKALPEETEVYPGHDYGSQKRSTIGWEKVHNRFLLATDFEEFRKLRLS